MGLTGIPKCGHGKSKQINTRSYTHRVYIHLWTDCMYNVTKCRRKVKHWSKITMESQTLKQNIIVMSGQLLLRTHHRAACLKSVSSSSVTTSQLFFTSLLLLHLRFDPVTLSKGNTINSKTRQNNTTQVNRRLETAGCVQFVRRRGEETEGLQLGWAFTLLHTLKETNQASHTNTYAKAKPCLTL
jgi:hypothetical protein